MTPLFSLRNLQRFRGPTAVLHIDQLDLMPHRLYCLTGANGAGKSTLLSLLSLVDPPCRGTLEVHGRTVPRRGRPLRELRQQVTLVHQNPYLLSGTVERNLAYGLKLRTIPRREQRHRITWALQTVGLNGFEDRNCRELSGGEIQRVALARALALKPRILLLDEPTASLDSVHSAVFEKILAQQIQQGLSVVMSTHDSTLPERLGGETIHLSRGRIDGHPRCEQHQTSFIPECPLCLNPLKMHEV